jgi:hypothetical protein
MNAILVLTLMAVPGQAAPLASDPVVADRGQVRGGPVLHQRFTLANKGQVPLNIVEARTSCGCLTPRLASRSLKPGEATTLDLDIGTISQPEGDNLWSVRVLYQIDGSDTQLPMDLRVKATLVREVGVTPAALRLIGSPNLSHEITLTDRRSRPFEVIAVRSASGKIATEDGSWQQVDGNWVRKIRVHIADECQVGKFEETVVIYGSDPDYRELRVTVNGERRDKRH